MLTNKVTLELEIPVEVTEEAAEVLMNQAAFISKFWKGVTTGYKEKGITVPIIGVRGIKKPTSDESKEFTKKLLDHHLLFMPKDNVASQMVVIKQLYATGMDAGTLINLYEQSRAQYALTSWHTVKYNLTKKKEPDFVRNDLNSKDIEAIKERIKP